LGGKPPLLSWTELRMISPKDMVVGRQQLLEQAASTGSLGMFFLLLTISKQHVILIPPAPIRACLTSFLFNIERSKLKEHMQYCVDNPEEINKLAKVKAQVSEVKGVMMENIEKVLFKYFSSRGTPLLILFGSDNTLEKVVSDSALQF
jgi:hypothetical protein